MDSFNPYGKTWLWHPTGAKVEVPLPGEPQAMFSMINAYLTAGFTVEAPENAMKLDKMEVAFVVRAQFLNAKKNEVQTRLYFYREYGEMGSDMTVYINDDEDAAKFEQFSGLSIAEMTLFEGDVAPQRTGLQFAKYAVPVKFTITREKEAPSQKYANGRWRLVDYIGSGKPSVSPQNGAETKITPMPVQTTTSPKIAQNGASVPVVTESEEMLLECTEVYAQKSGDSVSYVVKCGKAGNIVIYTRQPFRDAGYSTDDWNEVGGKGRTVATFNPALAIVAKKHGQSLELVKVQF